MIEMRWLVRPEWDGSDRVLQYRQKIDINFYAGMGPFPDSMRNMQWGPWIDVPVVKETENAL